MVEVKVVIADKDRKVGAMVKALAVEVSGFEAVSGTTKDFLEATGYYVFHFPSEAKADEFRNTVRHYIPSGFARVA